MTVDDAKLAAQRQWNADPCGPETTAEPGTLAYFDELVAGKFGSHSWMPEVIGYDRFAGRRVLDVGCGQGVDVISYARGGAVATGIDLTPRHLELARAHVAATGVDAEIVEGDAEHLPFPDDTFDRVSSNGVLHHTTSIEAALAEIRRVLKPGGEAMVIVYNTASWHYWLDQVLWHGLYRGQLREEGWKMSGVMSANVERSSIGARPLVNTYTPRQVRALLRDAGFSETATTVRQFMPEDVTLYDLAAKRLPVLRRKRILRALGRTGGWYVVGTGRA